MSIESDHVPFLDLKAQFSSIRDEVLKAVVGVVESQGFILGPDVEAFENEVAEYLGVRHAVGVASGTDALILTLRSLDFKPGDEVITTPYTFFSTVSAIVIAGGKPVFADIRPHDFNIDPEKIREALTARTRAIIPVHLFGSCADMEPIMKTASEKGIFVLEDTAQALGAGYMGKKAGALGDAAALSFYPTKTLGAFGDAGMVISDRDDVFDKVQALRVHGSRYSDSSSALGANSRLDSIQAAVLRVKLRRLDQWLRARRDIAKAYEELFKGSPVETPGTKDDSEHAYNSYVVRVRKRDELAAYLKDRGIGCAIYYPMPLYRMNCFAAFAPDKELPHAEKASRECLALPIYPEMSLFHAERVAEAVKDFMAGK